MQSWLFATRSYEIQYGQPFSVKRACKKQYTNSSLYSHHDNEFQRCCVKAKTKCSLPLASHGFCLSKGEFRDALCLRYGWTPDGLPSHCPDGNAFTVEHTLSCPRGGYIALRHNEIRDVLAELMQETCCNVATEPELQPLSGEVFEHRTAVRADGARLDIRAGGFWATRHEVAYFDVRVFNPYAASYLQKPLRQVYRMHEQEKQRAANRTRHAYAIGIHLHGRCRPRSYPVPEATRKPDRKHQMAYSQAMGWLRCRLSFALLRSSILCLRGARARVKQNFLLQPAVALAEGGMCWHFWLRTDQDQPSKYFFLHTDMHSPLDSIPHTFGRMHAPVHRRTCYPAHMHAHTFPRPVDSTANLLLLFMSISSCCYFYVFSSVCNKSLGTFKKTKCRWDFASKNSTETRKINAAAFELVGLRPKAVVPLAQKRRR